MLPEASGAGSTPPSKDPIHPAGLQHAAGQKRTGCPSLLKKEEGADEAGCESTAERLIGPASTGHVKIETEEGTLQAISPVFPGFPRPTVEDCRALDMQLAALHGVKEQPPRSGVCE